MTITKTNIVNQALITLGELVVTDVDTDTSKRATTMKEIFDVKLKYLLRKYYWKFATKRVQLDVTEYYLDFDALVAAPVVDEVVSGAVGIGTVTHFIYTSATAGRLFLKDVTTGFVDDENITGDESFDATANGVETAATPLNEFNYMFALPSDYVHFRGIYPSYIPYRIEGNFILCDESDTLDIKYTYLVTDYDQCDAHFIECFAALLGREAAIPLTDSLRKQTKMDEMFEDKIADARFSGSIEDDIEELTPDSREDWIQGRL